jgi:DNA-binding YbaB/EbfC family protein
MKGLSQLMRQAQEMQANMQKAQDELAATEVEGVAGGGMVKVVVTCKHEVRRVTIEESLLRDDKEMLEDLVAAAFNDAHPRCRVGFDARLSSVRPVERGDGWKHGSQRRRLIQRRFQ